MSRRRLITMVLLLAMAGCEGSVDRPTSTRLEPGGGPETATAEMPAPSSVVAEDALEVTCTARGPTLRPASIAAGRAGVEVRFSSPLFDGSAPGWAWSWSTPTGGRGGGLDPSGSTTLVVPLPPGSEGEVGCSPPRSVVPDVDVGDARWSVRPEILVPAGVWRDPELDCGARLSTSAYGQPVRAEDAPPVARQVLDGYFDDLLDDDMQVLGYPDAPEPVVGVVRDGHTLARVGFTQADDGLLVANGITVCESRGATKGASAGVAGVEELPTGPLVARAGAAGAWTGREVVLWGGRAEDADAPFEGRLLADGAAYDPATRRWRMLPDAPLTPRSDATAVWDGDAVVIAGGYGGAEPLTDAAAFDPVTNRWRSLPSLPASPAALARWGEALALVATDTSARPAVWLLADGDEAWVPAPPAPVPPGFGAYAAVAGDELVVLSSPEDVSGGATAVGAALADPEDPSWRSIAPPPIASSWLTPPLWSGAELLVLNQETRLVDGGEVNPLPTPIWPSGAYDPAADAWRAPALPGSGQGEGDGRFVAGRAVFVGLGGTLSAYDPETDAWSTLGRLGGGLREARTVVAIDDGLLAWGGDASYEGFEPTAGGQLVRMRSR